MRSAGSRIALRASAMAVFFARSSIVLGAALSAACAITPEPVKEPLLGPADRWELFRRARFEELENLGTLAAIEQREDQIDRRAQELYRRGDAPGALAEVQRLGAGNRTHQILRALIQHSDPRRPLRDSERPRGRLDLPLSPSGLDRGYVIVKVEVGGHPLQMLW